MDDRRGRFRLMADFVLTRISSIFLNCGEIRFGRTLLRPKLSRQRRANIQQEELMQRSIFIIFFAAMLSLPGNLTAQETTTEVRVELAGLVCDFCARAIDKTFSRREEVAETAIDLTTKLLVLRLKPGMDLPDDTIETLVRNAGYNVVGITRDQAPLNDSKE
jgi:hypothetical protein